MEILVATCNEKKRRELETLLKKHKDIKLLSLNNLDIKIPPIIEDGKTFEQNAVKKAVTTSRHFEGLVLADDSGLECNALGGKPGVYSARFAGPRAHDAENNKKLLRLLKNVPSNKRSAQFTSCIAAASHGALIAVFRGTIKGKILFGPKGENGFGYDPLFVPNGYKKTFAQMTASFKNRISHRAKALHKFAAFIPDFASSQL